LLEVEQLPSFPLSVRWLGAFFFLILIMVEDVAATLALFSGEHHRAAGFLPADPHFLRAATSFLAAFSPAAPFLSPHERASFPSLKPPDFFFSRLYRMVLRNTASGRTRILAIFFPLWLPCATAFSVILLQVAVLLSFSLLELGSVLSVCFYA